MPIGIKRSKKSQYVGSVLVFALTRKPAVGAAALPVVVDFVVVVVLVVVVVVVVVVFVVVVVVVVVVGTAC